MLRVLYVLAVIGLALSLLQIAHGVVEWINSPETPFFLAEEASDTLVKILVYFLGGALVNAAGLLVQLAAKRRLLGAALYVAGFYLMLLGANGGFWTSHHRELRLGLSALIVVLLVVGILRLERGLAHRRAAVTPPADGA